MKMLASLLLTALLAVSSSAFAQSITLDKDTSLVPQGWSVADELKFKKDTVAELTDDGLLISGVLARDSYLRPSGWQSLANDYYYVETVGDFPPPRFFRPLPRFGMLVPGDGHLRYRGGSPVVFNTDGTVLSGVIDKTAMLQLKADSYGFLRFKSGTLLSFYASGRIKSGTLDEAEKLRPAGWQHNQLGDTPGFVEFKAGSYIYFDENGYVLSGTPKKATLWRSSDGSTQTLAAGKPVSFTADTAVSAANAPKAEPETDSAAKPAK